MRRYRLRRASRNVARRQQPQSARLGRSGVRLVTLGLVALTFWLLASFVGQVITSAQMERHKEALRAEIAQLEAENAALQDRIAYAESPAYAERIAREQLGYAREGDTVILPTFPEQTATPVPPTPAPLPTAPPAPNWRGWMRALFPPDQTP
jgi:cell division protein FtsB